MNCREVIEAHLKTYERALESSFCEESGLRNIVETSISTLKLVIQEIDENADKELEKMHESGQG